MPQVYVLLLLFVAEDMLTVTRRHPLSGLPRPAIRGLPCLREGDRISVPSEAACTTLRFMLTPVADGLFCATMPLRFLGLQVGARMTIARLAGGGLFIHSPVRLHDELRDEVERLGPVLHLVAPNRYHHLHLGAWATAFPEATCWAAPGLVEKRPDLRFHQVLSPNAPPAWAADLDQTRWEGAPALEEVVFRHRQSRTLVLTDTAHNLGPSTSAGTRIAFRLLGGGTGMRTSILDRLLTRDRPAACASLERVLAWDFDRVIVSHGEVLERGGRDALAAAYRWLLKPD
jgi:hypothetical protein